MWVNIFLHCSCTPVALHVPAPIAQLVECPLRGTGGHGFDPGPRHTKVVKNGTTRTPLIKGIHQLNPSKSFFNNNSSQRGKKELESPPTLKQSTRTLSLGYTEIKKTSPIKTIYKNFIFRLYRNWKKEEGAGARSFFVWFVIGLFETLICAIAEDKVCDSCIVSSWALLIFLLCLWWPNSNFLCCGITQNGESSRDLLLSVTNRKALAPGGCAPQTPHPLQNIYYITTSHFLTTRLAVGCWLRKKVSTLIGYLLTDGLNCLTVKYLAGWHLE